MALGLLFVRGALSQMVVPTRPAFAMAIVMPAARSAAASFTAVLRFLSAALNPTLSGALFAVVDLGATGGCGPLKVICDLVLWRAVRRCWIDDP